MNKAWKVEVDGDWIAWLTLDSPGEKVNTLSREVLEELSGLIEQLPGDKKVRAVVVTSGKRGSFIAGADIKELARITDTDDARIKAEVGQGIFRRLAACPIPVVAVIEGACLGGGLELALACDYRLAADHPKTSLGLPEVSLGILPGWGGTQRLPRLIGLGPALTMILAGKASDSRRAYRSGLVDGIVAPEFAREQARDFVEKIVTIEGAREVQRRRRRGRSRLADFLAATPLTRWIVFAAARREVMKRTRGHYPAPLKALEVIRSTWRNAAPEAGLPAEAKAFAELAVTPASRNLVWLFQAGQRLKKANLAGGAEPAGAIATAGVVGAGIMGGGIAWSLAQAGIPVRLKDVSWEALARGMQATAGMCRSAVKSRRMTAGQMNLAMHRIGPTVDWSGFRAADVVIEAVAEDMEIKTAVLRGIEENVGPETIIATNTSSLSLEALAAKLKRPQRFVGLHFFNPVNKMPLVEVVAAAGTDPRVIAAAVELVKRIGKTPLVVGSCAGFLVNRILLPYLIESAWMFEEGVPAKRLDGLLEGFGMPMGPLALADEVGIDVGYKVAKVLEDAYGERMHVPRALGAVAETGKLLGKKSGRGFYVYRNGHAGRPNRAAARVARQARKTDGVTGRPLADSDIVDRAVLIMVNEAARCLEEGVIDGPEALDMAMVMGTGFAPFRGGLLRYADERGVPEIKRRLAELASTYGPRFQAAPLIDKIAGNGGHFHSHAGAGTGET